jgi:septal ring factor EnvC (AmiA/AmiB activator)
VTRSRTGFEPVLGRSRRRAGDSGAAERTPNSIGSAQQDGENAQLRKRIEELTPVLVGLASDLADARRESLTLRRENDLLRSRLWPLEQSTARHRPARSPEQADSEQRPLRRPVQLACSGNRD